MDTLAGSLAAFSLQPVVRLVAATGHVGMLKISSERLTGRVFIADGGIVFATTRELDGPRHRRLEGSLRAALQRDRRSRPFRDDPTFVGDDPVHQQVVEVFVRLLREDDGEFAFVPGVTPGGADDNVSEAFDVDSVVSEASRHLGEWRQIEAVVSGPFAEFQVAPELPTDQFEVTLDGRKWLFLSAIGERASVDEVAERLGIFEFPAAVAIAELIKEGLVVPISDEAGTSGDVDVRTSFVPAEGEPARADSTPPAMRESSADGGSGSAAGDGQPPQGGGGPR